MHQPSRVLQQCAYNTSKRIGSMEQHSSGIKARDARHLFGSVRPHLRANVSSYVFLCRRLHEYCKRTSRPLFLFSNQSSARQGMATYPEYDATKRKKLPLSTTEAVDTAELDATYGGVIDWIKVIIFMDSTYGAQGVFTVMERLRERESLDVVMTSDLIRNAFVNAGIQLSSKRQLLLACADDLLQRFDYRWPNLYTRCMHFLLENESFEEAAETHAYLAPSFLPDRHVLGLLFENFVSNPDIRMQEALKGIYLSLPQHDLYDIIIPALFKSGQSKMAKRWRQTFLLSGDFPFSEASGPFLAFLASYYTNTNFTPEERRILDLLLEKSSPKRRKKGTTIRCIAAPTKSEDALVSSAWRLETSQGSAQPRPEIKSLVDGFVEKLFASSWTPPDLAMQLAKNAGIRSIGPRAFQALALRASSATEVNELIKSLHKLNISIPAGAYCTAISEFAKQGHDSLLSNLLQSDIHPEEFDDEETRQMILEHSIRRRDTKQEDLMRSVMSAIDAQTRLSTQSPSLNLATAAPAFTIEKLLFDEPWRMKLALERMVSLNLRIGSIEASAILRRAFAAFPANSRGIVWCSTECIHILDEVIGLARCIAAQDVAIRSEHWKMLLIGLGHQGRLDALAQLSLELVDMYDPSRACLLPVHKVDLPKMTKLATDFLRRTEHSGLIPADLSFYHHHHPLFKIFDGHFQRTVVQLGFTWALNLSEGTASTPVVQNALVRKFDVASGIHILADLRDRGVFIDMDLVESAARNGIYSSQRMRQRDGDSRGRQWFSPMQMKKVADLAWGATLMPASYVIGLNQKDFRALSAPMG